MKTKPDIISIVDFDGLANALDQLGSDHNMQRDRPYDGQPWTANGVRGSTLVAGLTMRDISDCFMRAFIMSHSRFKDNTMEELQPNATLINEANKGDKAVLSSNDLYTLIGDIDPVAVSQNLGCEIEKMMGIFPNIKRNTGKDIYESLFENNKDATS